MNRNQELQILIADTIGKLAQTTQAMNNQLSSYAYTPNNINLSTAYKQYEGYVEDLKALKQELQKTQS